MINNKWMENPVLSDISTEKMEVLTKILNGAGDMDAKQMLTYFIKETNQASKNGINFTDKETDAILEVLKADMSPEEIKRIDTIKKNGKHAWKTKENELMCVPKSLILFCFITSG